MPQKSVMPFMFICGYAVTATAQEKSLSQSFELIADYSTVSASDGVDVAQRDDALRALATWEWQYQTASAWSAFANFKAFRGQNGEALSENWQGISNIDSGHFSALYEVYLQYQFSSDSRLKCGQVDANLEFAFVPVAAAFISPPLGITPTAIALPTYADPALSCSFFYQPERGWQWQGGLFAGTEHNSFSDQFYVLEGRYVTAQSHFVFGHWRHNGQWPLQNTADVTAIDGWYLNYQYRYSDSLTLFAVWSGLTDAVDSARRHLLLGAVQQLPWPGQQLGLMFSQLQHVAHQQERMMELYWQLPVAEQLMLQPVVQYIDSPAAAKGHAWFGTLRLVLSF